MDSERQRYTVQAVSTCGRYAIMTKPFNAQRTYLYTITDTKLGVRGPCNMIFGPPSKLDTPDGAIEAMAMLESGEMAVSRRRNMQLTEGELARLTRP